MKQKHAILVILLIAIPALVALTLTQIKRAETMPLPPGAYDIQRKSYASPDGEVITFRVPLAPEEVLTFYKDRATEQEWALCQPISSEGCDDFGVNTACYRGTGLLAILRDKKQSSLGYVIISVKEFDLNRPVSLVEIENNGLVIIDCSIDP
jgi:hypothetical protein